MREGTRMSPGSIFVLYGRCLGHQKQEPLNKSYFHFTLPPLPLIPTAVMHDHIDSVVSQISQLSQGLWPPKHKQTGKEEQRFPPQRQSVLKKRQRFCGRRSLGNMVSVLPGERKRLVNCKISTSHYCMTKGKIRREVILEQQ